MARWGRRQTSCPLPGPSRTRTHAQPDVLARQIAQQSAAGAPLLELRKDEPYHGLDLCVGVARDWMVLLPSASPTSPLGSAKVSAPRRALRKQPW